MIKNKKTILITGGAGFVGSHLAERLINEGNKVMVIDNFSTGRRANLKSFFNNERFRLIEADITDFDGIVGFFSGVDVVFHLAALADIIPSIEKPRDYFKNNVDGTFNVLEASRQAGIKKIIYTASDSCYGKPLQYPTPESEPIKPQYPYALTKYLGELLVMHYYQVYHISAVSLRFANIYGPRSRTSGAYGAVIGVFLAQKLNNQPYTIVGDGEQTRDFTYVSDAVDAFILAAESDIKGEIFNVGSGISHSINYLVELLGKENGIINLPKRPGEPDKKIIDNKKIKTILGWSPKVSFEEGLKLVLAQSHYWKDAPVWTPDKIKQATKSWFRYLS